jgi:L-fuconolactonase
VIDAHHHLWDLAAKDHRWLMRDQPWATDAEMAQLRRSFLIAEFSSLAAAAGVTGSVVIQTVAEPWETPDLLALAAGLDPYSTDQATGISAPERPASQTQGPLAGVVGWTDLIAPAVGTR